MCMAHYEGERMKSKDINKKNKENIPQKSHEPETSAV